MKEAGQIYLIVGAVYRDVEIVIGAGNHDLARGHALFNVQLVPANVVNEISRYGVSTIPPTEYVNIVSCAARNC